VFGQTQLSFGTVRRQQTREAAPRFSPALWPQCLSAAKFMTIKIHETGKPELERSDRRRKLTREQDMAGFDAERVDRIETALKQAGVRALGEQRLP
jgi:hypothetical protein